MVSFSWTEIELVLVTCAIILIILLTVGGNLVVLFAFYDDPHLLTPSNHFLLSMAIADLLVGLIAMPFHSYGQIKHSWPFGDLFCKIWLTIDDVATMASVLSIVAITIERYWSINHSAHYRRYTTKTRIRIFSILIWLIPLFNFAPGIWFLRPHEQFETKNQTANNYSECIGAYHSHTLYLIIAQINFFAWPLVVIIILNALIVLNLYRRSHRFPGFPPSRGNNNNNKNNNAQRESKEKKIIDEEPVEILEADEHRNSDLWKRMDGKCNPEDHHGKPPLAIEQVDEPLMIESQPITLPLSEDNEFNRLSPTKTNIYKRFKNVLLSSSSKLNRSSNEIVQARQQPRLSIFAWRNSSVLLSPSNTNANLISSTGEHRNVRRLRRDKRAATSLLILVLVFMIFLLPYVFVVVVGRIFSLEVLTNTDGQVYSAAFWLLWLNSTVNPILYPFIQPKFRDAYRKIFLRLLRRRERLLSIIVDIQRDK